MQSSILVSLSGAAENDLEDGEADLLLLFNPVRNWLTWTIPTWFWWAVTSIGRWRILGNFYSLLYRTPPRRAQHDIRDSSSLFGARACCIMGLVV